MKRIILLQFAILLTTHVFTQDYAKNFTSFYRDFPAEKIYIHFDKDYYRAGETIWFKAYFYQNGLPAARSSNFQLEVYSPAGDRLQNKLYAIGGATTQGHIDLPDSLASGNYIVRAGTPEMMALSPELLYTKSIPVVSVRPEKSIETLAKKPTVRVSFFPESGHLVDGILTQVAFLATDNYGVPVNITGTIKTPEGVEIPVRTYKNGMGRFLLRPVFGKEYNAELVANEQPLVVKLPDVEKSGFNLHVQDEKGGKEFQLTRSAAGKDGFQDVDLVVTLNDLVVYDNRISFESYLSVKGHLLTDSLPSGILRFAVFNDKKLPIAERLAFVDNEEYKVKGSLDILAKDLEPRKKNRFRLTLSDSLPSSLSVSIVDAALNYADQENIYSRLLLTADIRGHVFNAAQYFHGKNDSTATALDHVMLTQGWSRYNWTDVLANKPLSKQDTTYLMEIEGLVTDTKSGKSEKGGTLNLLVEDESGSSKSYSLEISNNGTFRLDSLFFSGKGKFFYEYHTRGDKVKEAKVIIQQHRRPKEMTALSANWFKEHMLPLAGAVALPQFAGKREAANKEAAEPESKELASVVVTSKNKRPADIVNETYATGFFQSMGKIVLDNINQPFSNTSLSVVNYLEQSIRTIRLEGQRFVNSKNMTLMSGRNWEVGIMVNESPNTVANIRPIRIGEVALIKFYEAGFPGVSTTTPGGAIAIYLKEGGAEKSAPRPDEPFFEINGYSVVKEFYHPDYSAQDTAQQDQDLRTTLYWNPSVFLSSENPSIELPFYNNDLTREVKVVVEGFDAKGKLIHVEKRVK